MERHGAYIEFESEPGFELAFQSLENLKLRNPIRLLNVREEGEGEHARTLATVYVPYDQRTYFLRKIDAYQNEIDRRGNKPKNAKLINSISHIRHAILESFWRDEERELIPDENAKWVEVWLRKEDDGTVANFETLLTRLQINSAAGVLRFPERAVKLIQTTHAQLTQLIEFSDDIAEFRVAREVVSFYVEMENQDQAQLVHVLLGRLDFNTTGDVAVCILDTGVNRGHSLIQPVLDAADLHTVDPAWGTHDDKGHGTKMAGIVAYGDLLDILGGHARIQVDHRLESAKILPPSGQNPIELWGYMTAQGISRAEIQAPARRRIVCLAVTATETRDQGRPSSWSAEIDALTSGSDDNRHRLIVISGGNVDAPDDWLNYHHANVTNDVHDPGQAWNALTVGAFTEKVRLPAHDPSMAGYHPVAPSGGLSPFSTTSSKWLQKWSHRQWPIKPEVVLEGGNVARGPNNSVFVHNDLQLLSTYRDPAVAQFAPFGMTSASCALASRMAAQIQFQYPDYWPETIRALIVHTAEWTGQMRRQFLANPQPGRQDYAKLLRICGYGVPDLERSLYCASNSLTLISQAELQPFDRQDGQYVTRDMHLYNLPWPSEVLRDLRETEVRMRVTLSYFVEPGPGEIGWRDRYGYASHALRFEVNGPGESEADFAKRVNARARAEGEGHPGTVGPSVRWVIGDWRNVGSVHSDIWQGTAAELADSNKIAVYPVVGWWRERHHLNKWNKRCRYSLIVSIHTPETSADIYIPVATQIGITVPIEIRTDQQGR